MQQAIDQGMVQLGTHNKARDTWTINLVVPRVIDKKLKTVWRRTSHDAGTYGSSLLDNFLGEARLFNFPKSLYAVRGTLTAVCRDRPNALIVDFFAGSGTTLHATALLNRSDGGSRRCLLVTNNEVSEGIAAELNHAGLYRGDEAFESQGIFERVTKPRVEAALTGVRPDKTAVPGQYLTGEPHSNGFRENVHFYRLQYADPIDVELGEAFRAILPALWMAAGAVGNPDEIQVDDGIVLPEGIPFAVLLDEDKIKLFLQALAKRDDITHIWLVTDSDRGFARMRSLIPKMAVTGKPKVGMLYSDFLRNFELNTGGRR